MNDITIMESPKFGQVRKVLVDGEWYYVAKDVAKALGYSDTVNAIKQHCQWVVKHHLPHPQSPSKTLQVSVIPKGDVLRLISQSHLPAAQEFNHWLFDDVAVQVVDNGMYMSPEALDKLFTSPQFVTKLFTEWNSERSLRIENQVEKERLQAQVQRDAHKVKFADDVAAAPNDIPVGDLAKLMRQNGLDIGRARLFETLRNDDWLLKTGQSRNMPSQRSMAHGLMRVSERVCSCGPKAQQTYFVPMVTGKGQVFFLNRYCHPLL